jgi:hypothetical protein
LFTHLYLGLPCGLFPSGFSHRYPTYIHLLPIRATYPAHLIIKWSEYFRELVNVCQCQGQHSGHLHPVWVPGLQRDSSNVPRRRTYFSTEFWGQWKFRKNMAVHMRAWKIL